MGNACLQHLLEGCHVGVGTCQDDAVARIDAMTATWDVDVDATTDDAHDVGSGDVADVEVFECLAC